MTDKPSKPVYCPEGALSLEYETTHRGFWDCVVPADHSLEMVLKPDYFGRRCADKGERGRMLVVGDYIDIESEDCSWMVSVRVMAYSRALQRAFTHIVTGPVEFNVEVSKGYEIRWHGRERKWCIERDGDQIAGGFTSKTAAQIELEQMLKAGRNAA